MDDIVKAMQREVPLAGAAEPRSVVYLRTFGVGGAILVEAGVAYVAEDHFILMLVPSTVEARATIHGRPSRG
jgi:hypothetical protein